MSRIANVAKHTRKARKLFTGSGFSVARWGHQSSSLADSSMVELERGARASTGIKPAGRCRTIALVVAVGLEGIPRSFFTLVFEQVGRGCVVTLSKGPTDI